MRKLFTRLFIILLLVSCQQKSVGQHKQTLPVGDSIDLQQFITKIKQAPIINQEERNEKILFEFDKKSIQIYTRRYHSILDSLSDNFELKYKNNNGLKIKINKFLLNEILRDNYHNYSLEFMLSNILDNEIFIFVNKITFDSEKIIYSLIFKTSLNYNNQEFENQLLMDFILIINNDNIKDRLIVNYIQGNDFGREYSFSVFKDNLVYTKTFGSDELGIIVGNSIKYQISPQRRFIRYYDKNGEFKDEEEQGLVKNHTREGKWIEMKPNGFIDGSTYLEGKYQDGLPVGEFRYYNLEQEYNDKAEPIPSTRKKGKLLYTETYEKGELKQRKFIK